MRRGVRFAAVAFCVTWIPLTLVRGIALGREFRIGRHGQGATGPLVDAVIQVAFVMLAPALFVALAVFVFWAWREERAAARASSTFPK